MRGRAADGTRLGAASGTMRARLGRLWRSAPVRWITTWPHRRRSAVLLLLAFWAGGLVSARIDGLALMDVPYGRMLADGVPLPVEGTQTDIIIPDGADTGHMLRFATEGAYPPFNFVDATGALRGIEIDIIHAVCADLLVRCEIRAVAWEALLPGLARGEHEAVAASTRLPQEDTVSGPVRYTQPYLSHAIAFAARKDSNVLAADTAAPLVGVVADTRPASWLAAQRPDVEMRPYPSARALYAGLITGEVALIVDDAVRLDRWLNDASGTCCRMTGGPHFDDMALGRGVAFVVAAENEALAASLDAALSRLRAAGRIDEITDRYLPFPLAPGEDS